MAIDNDSHIIVYTDNSFSFFKTYWDWDDKTQSNIQIDYQTFIDNLNIRDDGATYFTSTQELFIKAEILNAKQLIIDANERIKNKLKLIEERDKLEFIRLKDKFEPTICNIPPDLSKLQPEL